MVLAVSFHKLQPCAVDFVNIVELKIYIALVIINAASILCYFVDLLVTAISFGVLLFLYILYSFLSSIKVKDSIESTIPPTDHPNDLVNDRFKKQ